MEKEITFLSHDKKTTIYGIIWTPTVPVKGIIEVIHGMNEYIKLYEEFAKTVLDDGYIVCGIDLLGHGASIIDKDHLGYFADDKKMSKDIIVDDIIEFSEKIKEIYKNIPIYLMGYSMGSFITKLVASKYSNNLNGIILIGTGYYSPFKMGFAKFIASYLAVGKTYNDRNVYLYNKVIKNQNKKFIEKDPGSWLTSDIEKRKIIVNNPAMSNRYTINAYYGIFDIIQNSNKKALIKLTKKDLPILILSGKDDPIGHFGKDIDIIKKQYNKNDNINVITRTYNAMRHNLLRERDNDIVINDILKFLNNR